MIHASLEVKSLQTVASDDVPTVAEFGVSTPSMPLNSCTSCPLHHTRRQPRCPHSPRGGRSALRGAQNELRALCGARRRLDRTEQRSVPRGATNIGGSKQVQQTADAHKVDGVCRVILCIPAADGSSIMHQLWEPFLSLDGS